MIVAKFGGSSLANAEQIKKVKDIVSGSSRDFIVVSAPGRRNDKDFKITDVLYLCYEHVKSSIDFKIVFSLIKERYIELVRDLKVDIDINSYLLEIEDKIINGATKDYIASRGEYLNGLIISKYLGYSFVDPKDLIIITRDSRIDPLSYEKVKEKLSEYKNAVIPGFYGVDPLNNIKTFSRGGSDITGSIISRALNADLYENWTDVSGFLMADPRIVKEPKGIEEISFKELRELSYMGANVFHEEAIFPLYKTDIPIQIKNTNRKEDKGTKIVETRNIDEISNITGISGKKDFTVIAIEKTLMKKEPGFTRDIISIFDRFNVTIEHMPSGIDSLSVIVRQNELNDKEELIVKEIERVVSPDKVNVLPNMALVAIVGEGMVRKKGTASTAFSSLKEAGINIRMINQGSNELSIILGVENEDMDLAIKSIYESFMR